MKIKERDVVGREECFITVRVKRSDFNAAGWMRKCDRERERPAYRTGHRVQVSGFGGLEVACWPLVLKFAGSNPAVRFLRGK